MARYTQLSFVTSSVPAGSWLTVNQPVASSMIDLVKLKVVPGAPGGTARFQVFKRDTFLEADKLYDTRDFEGSLIDPVEDYSDPMTDTPGATTERNEGPPIPYEDDDGTSELHLRLYNGGVDAKAFTVTIRYEVPALVLTGTLTVPALNVNGNLFVGGNTTLGQLWIQTALDIQGPTPTLVWTDTTPGEKDFKIVVEANRVHMIDGTAGIGTLLTLNLDNSCVGIKQANPMAQLTNSDTTYVGAEGYGTSPNAFVWKSLQSGWGVQIGWDATVTGGQGLLIQTQAAGSNSGLRVEGPGRTSLSATGDGRVLIGHLSAGGAVLHIRGDQRPGDAVIAAERAVAGAAVCYFANTYGDDQTVIHSVSNSPNYGANISLLYGATTCINFVTSAGGTIIDMLPVARAGTSPGSVINLGRNLSGVAGYVNFVNKNGAAGAVWQDAAGNLRIGSSGPEAGDTGGTVVGVQTSIPGGKQDLARLTAEYRDQAIARVYTATMYTYRVIKEVEAGFDVTHVGFIADDRPEWMMYDGQSIDYHHIQMEILISVHDLLDRVAVLEGTTPPARWRPPS